MSNYDKLGGYVNKILKIIINSDDCINLISPDENNLFDIQDVLLGGRLSSVQYDPVQKKNITTMHNLQPYIYDFCYTIGTTDKEKVFICVDATIDSMTNIFLTDFSLHLYIYAPKSMNRLSTFTTPTLADMEQKGYCGNRINMLCSALDKNLNGNSTFASIGNVKPANRNHATIFCPTVDYYGKHLIYTVSGYSEDGDNCGS